jgi:ATP-dependent DNA helicase RecQ
VQSFFLGGKYPRRAETFAVWEALRTAGEASVDEIAERTGLPGKRVKVIVAQLVAAGTAHRRRRTVAAGRALEPAELDELLSAYEKRHGSDRERLEEMMRYAQTTACRVRKLREYFAEQPGEPCGRCDNCRGGLATAPARKQPIRSVRTAAVVARHPAPRFKPGDPVRHRAYGTGQVVEITGDKVVVSFGRRGKHKIRAEWLRRA